MSPLLQHLAFKFADERAMDVILNECGIQVLDCVTWRDTNVLKTVPHVVWEVKYLHTRGLLCHHPMIHNLVRLRRDDEKTV
jgi:hypothetical protein